MWCHSRPRWTPLRTNEKPNELTAISWSPGYAIFDIYGSFQVGLHKAHVSHVTRRPWESASIPVKGKRESRFEYKDLQTSKSPSSHLQVTKGSARVESLASTFAMGNQQTLDLCDLVSKEAVETEGLTTRC